SASAAINPTRRASLGQVANSPFRCSKSTMWNTRRPSLAFQTFSIRSQRFSRATQPPRVKTSLGPPWAQLSSRNAITAKLFHRLLTRGSKERLSLRKNPLPAPRPLPCFVNRIVPIVAGVPRGAGGAHAVAGGESDLL